MQSDLWRFVKIKTKLKEKLGINPTVDQIVKELGSKWDMERVQEMFRYKDNLSGHISVEEEWKYAEELGVNPKWLLDNLESKED